MFLHDIRLKSLMQDWQAYFTKNWVLHKYFKTKPSLWKCLSVCLTSNSRRTHNLKIALALRWTVDFAPSHPHPHGVLPLHPTLALVAPGLCPLGILRISHFHPCCCNCWQPGLLMSCYWWQPLVMLPVLLDGGFQTRLWQLASTGKTDIPFVAPKPVF